MSFKCLTQDEFEYIDALILQQTSPEEAYNKFETISKQHVDVLRSLAKQINDARIARDNESIKNSLKDYDDAMEKFMPILMGQCKI